MARKSSALTAQLRHRLPGRTRIRLKSPVPTAERLEYLADKLSALVGVHAVDINPDTGSILIRHEHFYDPLVAAAEQKLIEILPAPEAEPFEPTQAIVRRIGEIDALVRRISGGRLDATELTIVGLAFGGLVQLARGQVAGPALTLFGQAATLVMTRPLRKFVK